MLLAHGTVPEVIAARASRHLHRQRAKARALAKLGEELRGTPGVDMVAPFGTSLHVSGRDEAALEAAIAPYRERAGSHMDASEPTLEDVFIDLMSRARDNFQ